MKVLGAVLAALLATACGARSSLGIPTDVTTPDASAPPTGCEAGPSVPIYAVARHSEDQSTVLYRFDPGGPTFTNLGALACPATPGKFDPAPQVFSMAIARSGTAYVLYDNGQVFEVDTSTLACTVTPFVYQASAFTQTFGMGFSADSGGNTESLYVASFSSPATAELGRLDTSSFDLQVIGTFSKNVGDSELTGTADGRLYGFAVSASGISVVELDKSDASVISTHSLDIAFPGSFAFAYWHDDLYIFLGASGTTVDRYHLADGTLDPSYAILADDEVYGAGVSTCAPL